MSVKMEFELLRSLIHAVRSPLQGVSISAQYLPQIPEAKRDSMYSNIQQGVARIEDLLSMTSQVVLLLSQPIAPTRLLDLEELKAEVLTRAGKLLRFPAVFSLNAVAVPGGEGWSVLIKLLAGSAGENTDWELAQARDGEVRLVASRAKPKGPDQAFYRELLETFAAALDLPVDVADGVAVSLPST